MQICFSNSLEKGYFFFVNFCFVINCFIFYILDYKSPPRNLLCNTIIKSTHTYVVSLFGVFLLKESLVNHSPTTRSTRLQSVFVFINQIRTFKNYNPQKYSFNYVWYNFVIEFRHLNDNREQNRRKLVQSLWRSKFIFDYKCIWFFVVTSFSFVSGINKIPRKKEYYFRTIVR